MISVKDRVQRIVKKTVVNAELAVTAVSSLWNNMLNNEDGFIGFPVTFWGSTTPSTSYIQSIQKVAITISAGNTSGTATISSVTTANTVLIYDNFTSADTSSAFGQFFAGLTLTNSTTVTATRAISASTSDMIVYCTVVEFTSSAIVSIQSGTITMASVASNTATISSVTTANSICFFQGWTNSSTDNFPGREYCRVTLTNSTTVTANRGTNPANTAIAYYTVVNFNAAVVQSIQQFSTTLNTIGTSITQTISSVNTNNSIIIYGGCTVAAASTVNLTDIAYTIELTNSTTVTLTRIGNNNSDTRIYNYTVWELPSSVLNSSVKRGTIAMTSQTSNTATITSVNTAKSFVTWCGFRMGLSSRPAGINFPSLELTNGTTVTDRMNTSNATTNTSSYEVVEFI